MAKTKPKRKSPQIRVKSALRKTAASRVAAPTLRGKALESAVDRFQSEPDEKKAHDQWKRIEASVFGVQFED
jgi:hypothetical protein